MHFGAAEMQLLIFQLGVPFIIWKQKNNAIFIGLIIKKMSILNG